MRRYNTEVIAFNEPKDRQFFPDEFRNEIYYSNLDAFSYFSYLSSFSIKFVRAGKEIYILNGKRYSASAGQYLLVNNGRNVETTPDTSSEALSIFVGHELISEVYQQYCSSQESLLDQPSIDPVNLNFLEQAYSQSDRLGTFCGKLMDGIISGSFERSKFSEETYYSIARYLVESQLQVGASLEKFSASRRTTREELYRRAYNALQHIEASCTSTFDFDALALHSGLSKYHLIRAFKAAFGITPYKFYLRCKTARALQLLNESSFSVAEISDICGFTDVQSFSKTFKKSYGRSPKYHKIENFAIFDNNMLNDAVSFHYEN